MEGDSAGAWQAESNARSIFEQVGDRVPWAQVTLSQADLLLDENKKIEAAAAIHEASELLAQGNSLRDQAFADLILARAAISNGKIEEATIAISRAKLFATRSRDKELEIASRLESARMDAATGDLARRESAIRSLHNLVLDAKAAGYHYASLEARLTLGILQMDPQSGRSGRAELAALHREASTAGFTLIADRAATELRNQ
ncbi:MAG: hypothetical protein AUG75_05490 [Cyanobacteria bacterium 13_1_20CM_4_61_6]|nr:MAG: hypothetical protein AUG75_05490 [Cyanobacteria bacterium 13_1_20CM_4_61_6]